jgi:glucose-6-phosphate isomerase
MSKQKLTFTYSNIEAIKTTPRLAEYSAHLKSVLEKRGEYSEPEHMLRLPSDAAIRAEVAHMVQRFWSTQLKYIFVVGIGGSNLGAQAVYEALYTSGGNWPKLIFLDTVSPALLSRVERIIADNVSYPEEFVVNVISKSGATAETIANADWLLSVLGKRFPEAWSRVVATTDRGSKLHALAQEKNIPVLEIPSMVGGRYSIFTSVGMFPLSLAGISVDELAGGASDALSDCLHGTDHALRLAQTIAGAAKHGASVLNFFFFHPELESVGKWCRQLYGESLGKLTDRAGKIVHAGVTPIVSIGSTDLHSMAQLYLAGPRDKYTLFVSAGEPAEPKIPAEGTFSPLSPFVADKSAGAIMAAIEGGVKTAYRAQKLPYSETLIPAVSAYGLGMFFAWNMLAVMYLAEIWNLNAFDQPNVEEYKRATREILEHKK